MIPGIENDEVYMVYVMEDNEEDYRSGWMLPAGMEMDKVFRFFR